MPDIGFAVGLQEVRSGASQVCQQAELAIGTITVLVQSRHPGLTLLLCLPVTDCICSFFPVQIVHGFSVDTLTATGRWV